MTDPQSDRSDAGGSIRADEPVHSPRWRVTGVVVAAALVAVCVAVGLSAALPANTAPFLSLRAPGPIIDLGLPAVRTVFDLSAAITIGWLLAAVALAPPRSGGRFDVSGYRAVQAASLSAIVWCASALALIPLTYANAAGQPLGDALTADSFLIAIGDFDTSTGALQAAVIAALVAVLARAVFRPATAFPVLLLAVVGTLPFALAGHASASSDHDLASDTMIYHLLGVSVWVGGLVAFLGLARQQAPRLDLIARRYSTAALIAFVAVALSGIGNAWIRLYRISDLWTSDYGRLVVVKGVLLTGLGVFGYLQRRRSVARLQQGDRRSLLTIAVWEIGVMAATIGVAVALGRTAPPLPPPIALSGVELVLGFDLPGPATFANLVTAWRFDLIFGTAAVVLAALYLWGVRRLRQRQIEWPVGRSVTWLLGCATVLISTSSGLGRYAEAQFSIHMISHMVLGMLAPILLVLGSPTTLALRALPASRGDGVPGAREALVGLVNSRALRWLTHPGLIFPLFVGSFYAIYFTPLFDDMVESHIGHLLMNLHFLLVGYLFYWVIIGTDPAPRRLSSLIKLAMLIGALPFHAFFGLALMNSRTVLAESWYRSIEMPGVNLLTDQHLGGGIAWGGAEIPLVIVIISLLAQWSRNDEREARRSDRKAVLNDDADLTAYNAMLQKMADRDRRH